MKRFTRFMPFALFFFTSTSYSQQYLDLTIWGPPQLTGTISDQFTWVCIPPEEGVCPDADYQFDVVADWSEGTCEIGTLRYSYRVEIRKNGINVHTSDFLQQSWSYRVHLSPDDLIRVDMTYQLFQYCLGYVLYPASVHLYDSWDDGGGDSQHRIIAEVDATAPTKFGLDQNYPNPFNPTTTIKYSVPVPSDVTLKIYSVLDQEVATVFQGQRGAGHFEAVWDGRNSAGMSVGTGVYFYKLDAKATASSEAFSNIKKMLLLK